MLLDALLFIAGIGVLYVGAEALVNGAAGLALRYGIRPLVVGLTVVALGTSMPEFVVNVFAALSGEEGIALGNIIGSNIANIALILGISALVWPLSVSPALLRKEYPMMLAAMVLFWLLALDGTISHLDGLMLVGGLAAFLTFVVYDARRMSRRSGLDTDIEGVPGEVDPKAAQASPWRKAAYLVGGGIVLSVGARMMIMSAVNIAATVGISEVVVGLTVVAIGTSLPELAASVVSAKNGEAELSVGNAMGSNLLNVLFVVGLVALMRPLHVSSESLWLHFPVMLGFTALFLPLAYTQRCITRTEGGVLVAGFLGYMLYLVMPYM